MADDTFEDIRRLLGRAITHRTDTNRCLILAAVVHDLQTMLARLIDRQGGTIVNRARLTQFIGPLIAVLRVTIGELVVIQEVVMGLTLPVLAALEALLGFADDLLVRFHCIQPVNVLDRFSLTGWCNSVF